MTAWVETTLGDRMAMEDKLPELDPADFTLSFPCLLILLIQLCKAVHFMNGA